MQMFQSRSDDTVFNSEEKHQQLLPTALKSNEMLHPTLTVIDCFFPITSIVHLFIVKVNNWESLP